MYKLLLCWRYLRTRYIALVCIVSVTLGVATMIVVNSVMAGFSTQLTTEMNAMLGDLDVQVHSIDGVADAQHHMALIRRALGDQVEGMSPAAAVPAMLYLQSRGGLSTRPVILVGIDEATYGSVSELGRYMSHPANRRQLSFQLHENGYDPRDPMAANLATAKTHAGMEFAGMGYRRSMARQARIRDEAYRNANPVAEAAQPPKFEDPFASGQTAAPSEPSPNSTEEPSTGIILALSETSSRYPDGSIQMDNIPGEDLIVSYPMASLPPKLLSEGYTIVDIYKDPMRIENTSLAFVPLAHLQRSRGMIDPTTGVGKFTSIQIKLKPGVDAVAARDKLRKVFEPPLYSVTTWQDKQALLLSAIHQETLLLNILLFFIVAVAGFGILSIFSMIVVEKTRDIGILKSLGASQGGIMAIFLTYGLTLGILGAGAGTGLGLAFAAHINEIKDVVEGFTGKPLFDQSIYFFEKLPTITQPWTIAWIVAGAIGIAVSASVLPARRAAKLHPVRALRFE